VPSFAPRRRLFAAAVVVLLAGSAVTLRLAFLQLVRHGHYAERAEVNQREREALLPVRGTIRDRDGRLLAQDARTYTIVAEPRRMDDPARSARRIARALHLDPERLAREFKKRPGFCYVDRNRSPQDAQIVRDSLAAGAWKGLVLSATVRRDYPAGPALAQITGRADIDNRGVEGIEYQFDSMLRGEQGWRTVLADGRGRHVGLPGWSQRKPVDGHSIELTVDADIQSVVSQRLIAAVDTLKAVKAIAVVLDPWTGEILAAASEPQPVDGPARNQAITDQFEPGSTFKMVVVSAALEEGKADPDDVFDAEHGAYSFAGSTIKDSHPYGLLKLRDAVRVSSNIIAGKLGLLIGAQTMYDYSTAFGFGALTGLEFPGETPGLLRHPSRWSGRSLPTIAMGHEMSVTALQLALAYGALANGGTLMAPQILKRELDEKGNVLRVAEPRPLRTVISEETAATMRTLLTAVVDSGTARKAQLSWSSVAGKTGTAQKFDTVLHTYRSRKYLASFVGLLPADRPRLVCVVMIDEPKNGYYGGDIAAPVFRGIMEDLYRLRGGPLAPAPERVRFAPPRPRDVAVPGVRTLPLARAREELRQSGLRVKVEGDGKRVLAQQPSAGARAERGTVVVLSTSPRGSIVPDVLGLTARDALTTLAAYALPVRVDGRGVVVRQTPAAGATFARGATCVLLCEERTTLASARGTE